MQKNKWPQHWSNLFIWSTNLDWLKKAIYWVLIKIMKNLFWWHVMILMNKPHFCSILEKYDGIFHANKEVKLLTVSWLIWWCFVVRSLLFVSFAYSVIQNDLTWPGIFCIFITFILFFFKTCQTLWPLKNILCWSITLFCQTLVLGLP